MVSKWIVKVKYGLFLVILVLGSSKLTKKWIFQAQTFYLFESHTCEIPVLWYLHGPQDAVNKKCPMLLLITLNSLTNVLIHHFKHTVWKNFKDPYQINTTHIRRTQLLNCQWNSSDIDHCQVLKYQSSEP